MRMKKEEKMDIELTCIKCGWTGSYAELVALTYDAEDDEFSYCPNCEHDEFNDEVVKDDGFL